MTEEPRQAGIIRHSESGGPERPMEAHFPCAVCGATDVVVRYLPPVRPMTSPGSDAPPGVAEFGIEDGRFELQGGPWAVVISSPGEKSLDALKALDSGDARELFRANPDFAPFYCRQCQAVYCARHWTDVEPIWDGPFFEETRATCPKGHRKALAD